MSSGDQDSNWQDECFNLMRLIIGVVVEYSSLIEDLSSPAGWALTDLRSVNRDLLQAMEDADEESARSLLIEARALLTEVIRLVG